MDRMWISVVTLRVIWTVIGQLGYIHPDEFFQSSEIVAGDILDVEVERTWEFDPSSPVRSIVPPYIMCAPAMYFIRWLNPKEGSAFWHSVTSQMILVLPRLMVTLAGIFIDMMVYGMASKLGCSSPRACLMTFATSYVSLVYYTRTLSNTIEAFLFVLLMNTVVSYWSFVSRYAKSGHLDHKGSTDERGNMKKSENSEEITNLKNSENQNHAKKDFNSKKKSASGKAKMSQNNFEENKLSQKLGKSGKASNQMKSEKSLKSSDSTLSIPKEMITMYAAIIALILVVGVFNRPTFPAFAAVPCIAFFLCDRHKHSSFGKWLYISVFKIFKMSAWISVASFIMILCDSFYYGSLSSEDFDHLFENINYLQKIAQKLTIAPWNFVQYNVNSDNLAEHGLHPHYLHLLVNTPLLFGILAIFPAMTLLSVAKAAFVTPPGSQRQLGVSKTKRSQFLISAYFLPILLLSLFPHQEPRFLIPLLCPIALLYGHHLFDIGFKGYLSFFWVVFNIFLCGIFYGALHQGGLIPSVYEIRDRILREPFANYHVIYSHTYMPPRHLFQIPNLYSAEESKIFLRDNNKFKHPDVKIHDMKGAPVDEIHRQINWIIQDRGPLENKRIFVVAPSSLDKNFCTRVNTGSIKIEYKHIMSFVPQITTENPPDFANDVFNCVDPSQSNFCNWTCSNSVFDRLSFALSLNLYSVKTT